MIRGHLPISNLNHLPVAHTATYQYYNHFSQSTYINMPKFSASAHHASYQNGKKIKKSKHRVDQYHSAVKARKVKQTRIKGIVEEVLAPVEPDKARPLIRQDKSAMGKAIRKILPRDEETQPVNIPAVPAEVHDPTPVKFNGPRIFVPASDATAK